MHTTSKGKPAQAATEEVGGKERKGDREDPRGAAWGEVDPKGDQQSRTPSSSSSRRETSHTVGAVTTPAHTVPVPVHGSPDARMHADGTTQVCAPAPARARAESNARARHCSAEAGVRRRCAVYYQAHAYRGEEYGASVSVQTCMERYHAYCVECICVCISICICICKCMRMRMRAATDASQP